MRRCLCKSSDAGKCLLLRLGCIPAFEDDEELLKEECECSCHEPDQDGYNEWGEYYGLEIFDKLKGTE